MQIQIDSREKPKAIELILKEFDLQNVKYFRSKLFVADYMSLDNPRLVIDRKQDLQELHGNICQQHERFKKELLRAIESGIKIVVLCEHGEDVQTLEDVYFFYQPPVQHWRWKTIEVNGKKKKVRESYVQNAIDGKKMYRSLCTIRDRYNVDFVFCCKHETGRKIIKILGGADEQRRD